MTDAPPPTGRPDEPAIVLDSVTKAFGDHVVLSDVSMRVAEGSVCAMIGPSGAGKSTLLRCINLLETPDSGTISVEGVTIHADHTIKPKDLAALRSRVGMVFQAFNLFPHLTVLRNVSLAQQRVLGRSAAEADERSRQLLTRVGLAREGRPVPVALLGRAAAADRDRAGARPRPEGHAVRRADLRPRPRVGSRSAHRHEGTRRIGHDDGCRHARDAVRPRRLRPPRRHGRRRHHSRRATRTRSSPRPARSARGSSCARCWNASEAVNSCC